MSTLDVKLVRDLLRLRTQALAIAGVVGAGIALFVAMFGALDALEESQQAFYERHRFAQVFATARRAPRQVLDRIRRIDGVAAVEGRIAAEVTLDVPGMNAPASGRLQSIPAAGRQPAVNTLHLDAGRLPAPGRADEVVLSVAFASANALAPGDTLGAILNGRRRELLVVGTALSPEFIYALGPGQIVPDDNRFGVLWMSERSLEAAFDLDGAFNDLALALARGADVDEVIRQVDLLLEPYGGTGAYDREDQLSHFFLENEFAQLRSFGSAIPPIFLLVAAFLLNLVIGRLVETERAQIGLLKAFGYSNHEVGTHYALMIFALSALGLAAGWGGGAWLGRNLTHLYADYFRFPLLDYRVDPARFTIAAALTLAAAAAGGLNAVRQAVTLSPAVAMAPPVPPRYRPGVLAGLMDRLSMSQPSRMIVRHLTRWPLRTAATSTGIAFSLALMMTALFFIDSTEVVIDAYFHNANRQDVTVTFHEPQPAEIEGEIARLPGVLATQPGRQIPVTLRHGHYSERQSIVGLAPRTELSRILDRDLREVLPPPYGIALSSKLAQNLHAGLGDVVTVEVMQGRRPVVQMEVTRLVEEFLGFAAYLPMDEVNRLMRERPVVTEVHLQVDATRTEALNTALKNTPAVSGVILQRAMRQTFRQMLDDSIFVMVFFYVLFSGMIAFGVSYNAARILFSERARSLASLRVLGFTRGEIAWILIGELAALTLLALPVGVVLGHGFVAAMSPLLNTDRYRFPAIVTAHNVAWSMLVVIAASALCWWMIHRRLHRLDLADALKTRE